ncbi:unnamed protein product, partial [Mesorhabditis belari]|uniref:PPM-type phosphatase domain-containing protein n=1 Tax=Mesorhabditis belari TaxID=2138241 RepID=A0AAF3EEN0_9BILA
MPSSFLRKRVYGLLRTKFSPSHSLDDASAAVEGIVGDETKTPSSPDADFYTKAFLAGIDGRRLEFPEVYCGKTGLELPQIVLEAFEPQLISTYTGPDGGLTQVGEVKKQAIARIANLDDEMSISMEESDLDAEDEEDVDQPISQPLRKDRTHSNSACLLGSCSSLFGPDEKHETSPPNRSEQYDWTNFDEERSFGMSTSLYEKNPLTGVNAGEPIADVWGIVARRNNSVMALADGVNWGDGARLAARCAVRGAIDYLNAHILDRGFTTTTEVFHELLASFHSAHSLILQEGGQLTTLCVAVIAPAKGAKQWVLCVCNVGDSLCFVYNNNYGVREVTLGSHDIDQMRDMRDAGGALGPVDGRNPQLHNLTCSMTFVDEGDIVFITSDGVSDNFDPVVGKFCVIKKEENKENSVNGLAKRSTERDQRDRQINVSVRDGTGENGYVKNRTCAASLPCVDAGQRHELMLVRMRDVIANGLNPTNGNVSLSPRRNEPLFPSVPASILCNNLVQFANLLSQAKRRTLENPELYRKEKMTKAEQRQRRQMVREKIAEMPGKLDHASVIAYKVGRCSEIGSKASSSTLSSIDQEADIICPPGTSYQQRDVKCHFENFRRTDRATCSRTLYMKGGDYAAVRLSINRNSKERGEISKERGESIGNEWEKMNGQPQSPQRATSPYEEMPTKLNLPSEGTRRKKHARGTPGRHTLGVDVQWLKSFVTKKTEKSSSPPASPIHHTESERTNDVLNERMSLRKRLRGILGSNRAINQVTRPQQTQSARGVKSSPSVPPPSATSTSSTPITANHSISSRMTSSTVTKV